MQDGFMGLFGILFLSVFVWFFMVTRLFKKLERDHPVTYENMGKPSLIMNNNFTNNIAFMKFLFRREWRSLGDDSLSFLGNAMLIFFALYLLGFTFLFFGVIFSASYS